MKFTVHDGRDLADAVKACAVACSKDSYRPALGMVELRCEQNRLTVTAMSGYVLVERAIPCATETAGKCTVLPAQLLATLNKCKTPVELTLEDEGTRLRVFRTDGNTSILTVDPAVTFDYPSRLWEEPKHQHVIGVTPETLIAALSGMKGNNTVRLMFDIDNVCAPVRIHGEVGSRSIATVFRL